MLENPALSASNFRLAIRSIMCSTRGIVCVSHLNALLTPLPSYTKRYPLNEPSYKGASTSIVVCGVVDAAAPEDDRANTACAF